MPVRSPRAWLVINGHGKINLTHAEVTLTRYGMPSTFIATMALDDPSNPGGPFWSEAAPIPAAIVATNGDGSGEKTLIKGNVDIAEIDWEQRTVTAQCSDGIAQMLDTRSDQQFPNMTSTDIVSQIAAKHGFNLHIDSVPGKAGTSYDGSDYAWLSDYENEWDVVQQLAHHDGKVAFAVGNDFYYVNPGSVVGDTVQILYTPPSHNGPPQMNGVKLRTWRNLQLSDFASKVASFHSFEKQPFVGDRSEPASTSSTDVVVGP